jgi:myosin-1
VVHQVNSERNFHIFYQFTVGASERYKTDFGIGGPECYSYTSMGNSLTVNGIDDMADYKENLVNMCSIFQGQGLISDLRKQ